MLLDRLEVAYVTEFEEVALMEKEHEKDVEVSTVALTETVDELEFLECGTVGAVALHVMESDTDCVEVVVRDAESLLAIEDVGLVVLETDEVVVAVDVAVAVRDVVPVDVLDNVTETDSLLVEDVDVVPLPLDVQDGDNDMVLVGGG